MSRSSRTSLLLVAGLAIALCQPSAASASSSTTGSGAGASATDRSEPRTAELLVSGAEGFVDVLADQPAGGTVTGTSAAAHGTATCDARGRCEYRPNGSFLGQDIFLASVTTAGESHTVTVRVRGQVLRPVPVLTTTTPRTQALRSSVTAAPGGGISGNVTVPSGSAGDVCVYASPMNGGTGGGTRVVGGPSPTSGTYAITGLGAGSYRVQFSGSCGGANYVLQYWQNTTDYNAATAVTVTDNVTTTGINATLVAGGTISGSVTVPSGSASDVCVSASSSSGGSGGGASVVNSAVTTVGSYQVSGLAPGSYRVSFYSCSSNVLVTQYWQHTTSYPSATLVAVTAGATVTGIDATMSAGGSISGTVTVPSGSAANVCVYAQGAGGSVRVSAGATPTSGTYLLQGIAAGSYRVQFYACTTGVNLMTQYWQNTTDYDAATLVSVVDGTTTSGINATMAVGGSISGTVTVPSGSASDVCASASSDTTSGGYSGVTSSSPVTTGTYSISGLPSGSFRVSFGPCNAATNLVRQYWHNTTSYSAATLVPVGAGGIVTGIDATMQAGASISGAVTVPTGSASDVCVNAQSADGSGNTQVVNGSVATSGSYTVTGLAPGTYVIAFHPCSYQTNLVPQYWQHTTRYEAATPVTVASGASVSGISAAMEAGGTVTGTVTVAAGTASDVCVTTFGPLGFAWSNVTASARPTVGTYALTGLPTGSTNVSFFPCTYDINIVPQYWRGSSSSVLTSAVAVVGGQTTSGIDASMIRGGTISGTVTVPSGSAGDVCVSAEDSDWHVSYGSVTAGNTATSGSYSLTGLPTSSYAVRFEPCYGSGGNLVTKWWPAATDYPSATLVHVQAGSGVSNVNMDMVGGGSISGTVTVPSGTVTDVCMAAQGGPADAVTSYSSTAANPTSSYILTGLPDGSYSVEFYSCSATPLASQFWHNAPDRASASFVAVTAGATATGIDATMASAASGASSSPGVITGTVTVPSGSAGDVCVAASATGGGGFSNVVAGSPVTTGTYAITGLPAGSYVVTFSPCLRGVDLTTRYSGNTDVAAQAVSVTVTAGGTASGVDAVLAHRAATAMQLVSSATTTQVGQSVTFTAAASSGGGPAVGDVTFLDNGLVVGVAQLVSGTATFTTSALTPGAHVMKADYLGDSTHNNAVSAAVAQQTNFTDVPTGAPFYSDIYWLTDQKIATGFADGSFRPGNSVVRQAFAAYLYRYAHGGADAGTCATGTSPFSDVADANVFCGDIKWLASTGLTTGFPDGTFHPTATLARQAIAAFFYRFNHGGADAGPCAPGTSAFNDVPASNAFCGDIKWLASTTPQAITTGFADGGFHPTAPAARQAMAAYFHRYDTDFHA
jgi:hypothetical protein